MSDAEALSSYSFGPYRLEPEKRQLTGSDGAALVLRGKAFDLLCYLVENRGRLVEKAELLDALWPGTVVEENNLNQAMSSLRQALADDSRNPKYIATIKGRGYQFIGDVRGADERVAEAPGATPAPRISVRAAGVVAVALAVGLIAYFANRQEPGPAGVQILERFGDATLKLVTDFEGSHSSPTLSPDGRMVAYVSDASGSEQIWVQNLERGDPIRITDLDYSAYWPSWSPDDDEIVFVQWGPNGVSIYSVGTLGTPEPRRIVENASTPRFGQYADAFVFSRGRSIWLARDDGQDTLRVQGLPTSQGFSRVQPALSPDGSQVAFVHADEGPIGNLWVIPVEGGEARQLTTQQVTGGHVSSPSWSGDGRQIVFTVNEGKSSSHIWRFDLASGEAQPVTTGPGGAGNPVLSRDGTRMAYTNTRSIWRLTRIDLDTGRSSAVLESRNMIVLPEFSPDGDRIVFFSLIDSGMQLFTIDADGDSPNQLTFDETGENTLPVWAGDGETILYYHGRSLYWMDPSDGSRRELYADFHWSSRNWLAARGDRLTYHHVHRPTRMQKTVIRGLGESEEAELPVPIEGAKWSKDGQELVGFYRRTGEIMICNVDQLTCSPVEAGGEPIIGTRPVWSLDGNRFFYLRYPENGACCDVWRVHRDGSGHEKVATLDGLDLMNAAYGVVHGGDLIYNHLDRSTDEIWLATLPEE